MNAHYNIYQDEIRRLDKKIAEFELDVKWHQSIAGNPRESSQNRKRARISANGSARAVEAYKTLRLAVERLLASVE